MMNLSFSAAALRDFDIMQAIHLVGHGGYQGVELELNDVHLHPMKSSKKEVLAARHQCESIGLAITSVAATGNDLTGVMPYGASLITSSRLGRRRRLEVIRRSIELTQVLECPVLTINSGPVDPQMNRQQAREYFQQALHTLQPALGETVLAIEPEPGFYLGTAGEAAALIEELGYTNVRLCLNIGHLFCEGGEGYTSIAPVLPHTRLIHMSDIKGAMHRHLVPGEGDINFMRVSAALERAAWPHSVCIGLNDCGSGWKHALDASRAYLLLLSPESVSA